MFVLFLEGWRFRELDYLTIDDRASKPLAQQVGEYVDEFAFASLDNGCEELKPRVGGQFSELIRDVLRRLTLNCFAALGAMRDADSRPQQSHVVVDFRDRANG